MNLTPGTNSEHGRLVLLAPPDAYVPTKFRGLEWNPHRFDHLLAGSQRIRGRVYSEDGAISCSSLTKDGRYVQAADEFAWHLLALDVRGEVCGCARYSVCPSSGGYSSSVVAHSSLSRSPEWGPAVRRAVESEMALARGLGLDYVEVGGWALNPEVRCTAEALRVALATFSLARMLGGCIGLTTATRRHCSASILRRIGGRPLVADGLEIPPYFDPQYKCQMEILRFHSAHPNPRFEPWISQLVDYLKHVTVIQGAFRSDRYAGVRPAIHVA